MSELTQENYFENVQNSLTLTKKIIEENFPNRSFAATVCLAVKAQLNIKDLTQPFALFLLGNPSSRKTTVLEMVYDEADCYRSDKFTPKSFVSHSANVAKDQLSKIDMLPKLQYKTFVTPELAPMFSSDRDNLMETFGILTRILDGRGLMVDSGVHGSRGYEGPYYFMWLGAVVEIPHGVWKIMGNLGPRIYFFRIHDDVMSPDEKIESLRKNFKEVPYATKMKRCKEAVSNHWFRINESPLMEKSKKIEWNEPKDDQDTMTKILNTSVLLSKLRGTVPSWHENGPGGATYNFEMPIIEDPERASKALYNLARGHAIINGRNFITHDDLTVVIAVALSSAQKERVALLSTILAQKGTITSGEFTASTSISKGTAYKNMKMMEILGICNLETQADQSFVLELKKQFKWFVSEEFQNLWNQYMQPKKKPAQAKLGDMKYTLQSGKPTMSTSRRGRRDSRV